MNTQARTVCSLAVLTLFLGGSMVAAQTPGQPVVSPYAMTPPPVISGNPQLGQPFQAQAVSQSQSLPPFQAQPVNQSQPLPPSRTPATGDQFAPPVYPQSSGVPGLNPAEEQMQTLTAPPGIERVAQSLQSDPSLRERIRQEYLTHSTPEQANFPDEPVLTTQAYLGRNWPQMNMYVAPNYVIYKRLLFQQVNEERYGWDFGVLHPILSAAYFYKDLIFLPYHVATRPFQHYDSNAGYCLPGDAAPYLIYPPEISVTGAVAEAGTILALVAIFP